MVKVHIIRLEAEILSQLVAKGGRLSWHCHCHIPTIELSHKHLSFSYPWHSRCTSEMQSHSPLYSSSWFTFFPPAYGSNYLVTFRESS